MHCWAPHVQRCLCIFFQSLPSGHIQGTFELANKEENREKNRYPNILPSKILLFFFFCIIGGILTKPGFALQLLVTLPGQQMARHSELRALAAQLPSPLPWEPERLVPTLGLSSSHHAWVWLSHLCSLSRPGLHRVRDDATSSGSPPVGPILSPSFGQLVALGISLSRVPGHQPQVSLLSFQGQK